jgi:hypothetical protein
MPKTFQQRQQQLHFDSLMAFLETQFQNFPDHRASNARFPLGNILKAAFAMFSLKSPSLLDFKKQSLPEQNNLRSIYRIHGDIPCDNQMRMALDPLAPNLLRPLFAAVFHLLQKSGLLHRYRFWQQFVIVSADGVEHFSSTKVHCPNCTTRTTRAGEISYHHAGLAAVVVHPDQREVFPLDFEPIVRQDGETKNDCERNAAKRLCATLYERYPKLPILLVEDALYANAPHLRQITGYGWHYILNVKPDSHKSLFKQFAGRRESGQVKELRTTDTDGVSHYYAWTKGLCLCESATEVKVHFLLYEQTDAAGKVTRWTWITDLPFTARTVEQVMRGARARWKIENETFNTLKNQGYNFSHNYGHGFKHLATVLALLMLLAFLLDQIQQACCILFRGLWQGLGSRRKLWESMRSAFQMLEFATMALLYRHIGYLYQIRLE